MKEPKLHSRYQVNVNLTVNFLLLNKESQCNDTSQAWAKQYEVINYATATRLSPSPFSLFFFQKNETIRGQAPTNSHSPGIETSLVIMVFLWVACDIIKCLLSAPSRRSNLNSVGENPSKDSNTEDDYFCLECFRGSKLKNEKSMSFLC